MELLSPQQIEAKVEAHFRVFLILWAAILVSVGLLATLTVVAAKTGTPNPTLSYALLGGGLTTVALSFLLKIDWLRQRFQRSPSGRK